MSTPLDNHLNDPVLRQAKQHLQALELDKALLAVDESLKKRQQESGADLSFYGTTLWCKILLAKGRFSKDPTFPTLAKNKLLELAALSPSSKQSIAFLPLNVLMGEMHYQLGEWTDATAIYQDILQLSREAENDIGEIQALNGLAKLALKKLEIQEALELANQSLELLIQHTDEANYQVLVENYLLQSQIFIQKKDLGQAKNYAERALTICQSHNLRELTIAAHLLLGKIALDLKDSILAITQLLAAKEASKIAQHQVGFARATLYVGIVYNQVFHYPKALENLTVAEQEYQDCLDIPEQVRLQNSLGVTHFLLHQEERAEYYFLTAERLAKKHRNNPALVFSLAFLGVLYARKDKFDKALRYAKRVNNITQQIGDVSGVQVNLINLGNVHNKLGKYSESIKLTSRGIAAAKRMKDGLSEIRGYQIMAEIFRKKKDFKSAVMYQMIYTKFYEDFYQRNDRQKVCEIEHQFAIRKLEQKIQALEARQKNNRDKS